MLLEHIKYLNICLTRFHEFDILNQIKVKVKIKVNADDDESQFHNFLSSRLALLANI